jgi:hypothetical protein
MISKHIIFVPGKNPKPRTAQHRHMLWRALIEGVRRADSAAAETIQAHDVHFHLVSWNYLYYHVYKDITREIPWVDALLHKHGPEKDIREAHSLDVYLKRFVLNLADHVPALIRFLPTEAQSTDREIRRYFDNTDNVASEIRGLLKQMLRPLLEKHEPVLLIGHSLGSVIASDSLWELTHQEYLHGTVDFMTLGSPLGMHYVQRNLLGIHGKDKYKRSYPELIQHWINVSAEGDIAALNRNLHEAFTPMREKGLVESIEDHCHGIYNFFRSNEGLNSHRSYGYLVNPAVGNLIAEWARRTDQPESR